MPADYHIRNSTVYTPTNSHWLTSILTINGGTLGEFVVRFCEQLREFYYNEATVGN